MMIEARVYENSNSDGKPSSDYVGELPDFKSRFTSRNVERVKTPFDTKSHFSDTSSEFLDRGINDMSGRGRRNGRNQKRTHFADLRRIEAYKQTADTWIKSKIRSDGNNLMIWRQNGLSYFRSIGIPSIAFMNPHDTPANLADWEQLDFRTYNSEWFTKYQAELENSGEIISLDFTWKDELEKLNAVYLAMIEFWAGLRTSIDAVIELTVDRKTLPTCFPPPQDTNYIGYGRYIFFSVFKKFVRNTEKSRLLKQTHIQSHMRIKPGQSIEDFANDLTMEIDTLNMLAKEVTFNESQKIAILKNVVTTTYPGDRYWTALHLLIARVGENFTFNDLVIDWHTTEKEIADEAGGDIPTSSNVYYSTSGGVEGNQTVNFSATPSTSSSSYSGISYPIAPHSSSNQPGTVPVMSASSSSGTKARQNLKKDSKGKLICFNYARDRTCRFGSKCKYSHEQPAVGSVLSSFTLEEVNHLAADQLIYAIQQKAANKWKKKFSKYKTNMKRRLKTHTKTVYATAYENGKNSMSDLSSKYSTPSKSSKSSKHSSSSGSTFQGAIREQKQKAKLEDANIVLESDIEDSDIDANEIAKLMERSNMYDSDSELSGEPVTDSDE